MVELHVDMLVKEVMEFKAMPGANRLKSRNLNEPGPSLEELGEFALL